MKINNETIAKKLSRKCYRVNKTIEDFCVQVMIENLVLPKNLDSYTEKEMEECIYTYLKNNNVNIDATWE